MINFKFSSRQRTRIHEQIAEQSCHVHSKVDSWLVDSQRVWQAQKHAKTKRLELDRVHERLQEDAASHSTHSRRHSTRLQVRRQRGSRLCVQRAKYIRLLFLFEISKIFQKIFLYINKEYMTYFEKLSYAGSLDLSDLEKLFNYCDLYPSSDEIKEAKHQVLKRKRKWFCFSLLLILLPSYLLYNYLN